MLTHILSRLSGLIGRKPLKLSPGDRAPDFTATDHNGSTVTLSQLEGKRFILWFYPKADTPG